jgi:hypothetical protein
VRFLSAPKQTNSAGTRLQPSPTVTFPWSRFVFGCTPVWEVHHQQFRTEFVNGLSGRGNWLDSVRFLLALELDRSLR